MGYAVYEDRDARDRGVERWAGYGVPAVCDHPECEARINRGMGYLCGELGEDNFGKHAYNGECLGCGMFFCAEHRFGDHKEFKPKPDTKAWAEHVLTDDTWAEWRRQNPDRTKAYEDLVAA